MSQTRGQRWDFLVPMRRLYAGGDLPRPDRANQCVERKLMRAESPSSLPLYAPAQTSDTRRCRLAPAIQTGADLKSP
jgi:hypothetical protein